MVKDVMFSKLTSILTMTTMLLHAVLGCCVHHVHACEHESSSEECQAKHVEHHSAQAEIAHADHSGEGHTGCSSHSNADNHESRNDVEGTLLSEHEEHDSVPQPPSPCQQNCDGGDCRFTQSPEVKTPSQNDGRLCCPSTLAAASMAASCRNEFEHSAAKSRPPHAPVTDCCRPMTQVWRL